MQAHRESDLWPCVHCLFQPEYAVTHQSYLQNAKSRLQYLTITKRKTIVFIYKPVATSFWSIATCFLNCISNILYCGLIVKLKVSKDVVNAF